MSLCFLQNATSCWHLATNIHTHIFFKVSNKVHSSLGKLCSPEEPWCSRLSYLGLFVASWDWFNYTLKCLEGLWLKVKITVLCKFCLFKEEGNY